MREAKLNVVHFFMGVLIFFRCVSCSLPLLYLCYPVLRQNPSEMILSQISATGLNARILKPSTKQTSMKLAAIKPLISGRQQL